MAKSSLAVVIGNSVFISVYWGSKFGLMVWSWLVVSGSWSVVWGWGWGVIWSGVSNNWSGVGNYNWSVVDKRSMVDKGSVMGNMYWMNCSWMNWSFGNKCVVCSMGFVNSVAHNWSMSMLNSSMAGLISGSNS